MTAGNSSKLKSQPQGDFHLKWWRNWSGNSVWVLKGEWVPHRPHNLQGCSLRLQARGPCTWVWWNYQTLLMASLPLPWPPPALVEFWHFFVSYVVLMCFFISWSTFSGNCFQQEPLSVRCSGLSLATPFPYTQLHLRDHYPCLSEAPTG